MPACPPCPEGVSVETLAPRAVRRHRRPADHGRRASPPALHRRRRCRHGTRTRATGRLRDPRDAGVDVQGCDQPDGLRRGRAEGRAHADARLPRRLSRLGRRAVARADRSGALDEAVDLLVFGTAHAGARTGALPAVHERVRLRQRGRHQPAGRIERRDGRVGQFVAADLAARTGRFHAQDREPDAARQRARVRHDRTDHADRQAAGRLDRARQDRHRIAGSPVRRVARVWLVRRLGDQGAAQARCATATTA